MSEIIFGQGTKLQRGNADGPPETFTTIAEVQSISGPTTEFDKIDRTSHDSPGGARQYYPGLKDQGELSFTVIYDPKEATHGSAGLFGDANARTTRNYKLIFPDTGGSYYTFSAFVSGLPQEFPVDDLIKANVTLTIDGDVTLVTP